MLLFFFFKQKTAYEMRISDWSSDVCSSDLFAATAYELVDVIRSGQAAHEDWSALAVAFVASAITAFISVKWLLRYIQSHRFTAFAVYRVALGAALLLLLPAASATAG